MYQTQAVWITFLLLSKLVQVLANMTANCAVELQIPRNSKYSSKPGNSLSIKCPVKYCTEKPVMNWCKEEQRGCLPLKEGSTRYTEWAEGNVFLLNFVAIQPNNSGRYRCQAVLGSLRSESHVLSIIVEDNVMISLVTGRRAVLSCSNMSPVNLISISWKIRLQDGTHCLLTYRADLNQTGRTNCSERMNWASRPDHDLTLQIYPLRLTDEGNYMCEIVNRDGILHRNYTLAVLVFLEPVGFSLLLHYLLAGSTIFCGILLTILYCTLQRRVTLVSGQEASASVLRKTGNNLHLNPTAMPDNPNERSAGMPGVSHGDQSQDIYENVI